MVKRSVKILTGVGLIVIAAYIGARLLLPPYLDRSRNRHIDHASYTVSAEAAALHQTLTIMDWHADTMLWNRDLLAPSAPDHGSVSLSAMQRGNQALQMFTTVTKVPWGLKLRGNPSDSDMISLVAPLSGWPATSWNSILNRALYQTRKLDGFIKRSGGAIRWVRNQGELKALLAARAQATGTPPVGALLGAEGAQPLEGKLENIDKLYDAGFRMVGLTHFFDNEVGGSLHGQSGAGLTEFGKKAVRRMEERGIIIDIAHASEQTARDTLALSTRPLVMSHTGLRGACKSDRNIPDDLVKAIAERGGLIAIGVWQEAVCGTDPDTVAASIAYGVALVGPDHIALGTDWDGAIPEAITPADLPALTDALLSRGLSKETIAKVMGGNSARFLARWLPEN